MTQYIKSLFAVLVLLLLAFGSSGCTFTAACYGYNCGMPYDYGVDAQRFTTSGTERGTPRYYGPRW